MEGYNFDKPAFIEGVEMQIYTARIGQMNGTEICINITLVEDNYKLSEYSK